MKRRRLAPLAIPACWRWPRASASPCWSVGGGGRRRSPPGVIPDDRAGVPTGTSTSGSKTTSLPLSGSSMTRAGTAAGGPAGRIGGGYGGGGRWMTDWPDSDLNFSYRLQQLTALKVNPDPIIDAADGRRVVRLSVPLHDRAGGPGLLADEEVVALRRYLLNGGFLMVDDFWGDVEWRELLPADQTRLSRSRARGIAAGTPDLPLRLPPQG